MAYDEYLSINPTDRKQYKCLIDYIQNTGKIEEKLQVWVDYIFKLPYDPCSYNGFKEIIQAHKELGNHSLASYLCDRFIAYNPEGYREKIQLVKELKKFDELEDTCNKYALQEPEKNEIEVYREKVQFFKGEGRFENCLTVWDQFISRNPKDFDGYKEKIEFLKELNKIDQIQQVYDKEKRWDFDV